MIDMENVSNDSKVYEIAKLIDNQVFLESIKGQIAQGLDCSTINYFRQFNVKLKQVTDNFQSEDYHDVVEFKDELCRIIISSICEKYDIEISYEDDDLVTVAKSLYAMFVLELRNIVVSFITEYVIENYKTVIDHIGFDNLKTSFLPDNISEDEKYKLTVAGNIGMVIETVADFDIGFDEFVRYAARSGESKIIAEIETGSHILSIADGSGIYSTIMGSLKSGEYDHNIQMNIYDIITSNFEINKKEVSIYGENFIDSYENESDGDGDDEIEEGD